METNENKNETGYRCGSPRHRAGWIALGILGFTAFAFLFGAVVMWLWNWLMPVIFNLGVITYWQAVGLAILGRLLFGSLHHGGSRYHGHHRFGHWGTRYHSGYCRDYSHSDKWRHYEQYWNEEGQKAFEEYVKKKTDS